MDERTLRVLEYGKIINMLEDMASSSLGKEKCRLTMPITDLPSVEQKQRETQEGVKAIGKLGQPPLFGITDLKESLVYAGKGGRLSPAKILAIADLLRGARAFIEYIDFDEDELEIPIIQDMGSRLTSLYYLEEEIERAIISEDEISDDASGQLRNIRRSLNRKTEEIDAKMNQIVSSRANKNLLQEPIVTIRNGKYVVPVKSQYQSRFSGVVHDKSSSGQTVFMEPMAVVNIGNEILMLEREEEEEINRILLRLSAKAADRKDEIIINKKVLSELDYIFARSKLALAMDGTRPVVSQDKTIDLIDMRHPLLGPGVVPISIKLGDGFTTLVITGPNTGGKTVSLKTVGLACLMTMAGLHIPAEEGSRVSIFNQVFADIGDEQSIEQSLSTFSSHMTNIIEILKKVDEDSLVLFDELGAGTDPTEGAALAMAILNLLLDRKIRTIATTHYSQLKTYAISQEGVENGSVEFDVENLMPTYKLVIGLPGKSNAFEISRRLGLSPSIISQAEDLLSKGEQDFEGVLADIEAERKRMEILSRQLNIEKDKLRQDRENLDRRIQRLEDQRDDAREEARREARKIIEDAQKEARLAIRQIRKLGKTSKSSEMARKTQEITESLREQRKELTDSENILDIKSDEDLGILKLGDEVEVLALGESGSVIELPDSRGNIVVEIGILKVNSNVDNVRRVVSKAEEESQTTIKNIIKERTSQNIDREVDLRGKNVEEAIYELDKYIDNAFLVGLEELIVIHGKGTGALRKGLEDYFDRHRLIKSKRLGEFGEGGSGVTIISFK